MILTITKDKFNKLSQNELLACFNIVTHDGSDQYVIDWNSILDHALDYITNKSGIKVGSKEWEDIDLTKHTNTELLRMFYDTNSEINGNNHERLIARIIDGMPVLCKVDIEDLF